MGNLLSNVFRALSGTKQDYGILMLGLDAAGMIVTMLMMMMMMTALFPLRLLFSLRIIIHK